MLLESRRVPEVIVQLKCQEKSTMDRMIDSEAIKAKYDEMWRIRREDRAKVRAEARTEKLTEVTEELKNANAEAEEEDRKSDDEIEAEIEGKMKEWDEDRDAEEETQDEEDPEAPNLENMMEEEREKLRAIRESDEGFLEEFGTAMKDKNVVVLDELKTDISADYVFIKLLDKIKSFFFERDNIIERDLAVALEPKEVPFYEKSHIYKHSKFGLNCPVNMNNPRKTKRHAVLYRERIYFPGSDEARSCFMKEPSKYTCQETVPLDLNYKPKIFLLGLPKSGQSTIA